MSFWRDLFTSTDKGEVPASGGGTTNFLRADGTWAAPSGGASWTKVTKAHTDWTAAATSEAETIFTLAAGEILRGVVMKHTTAFAGTSWTAATIEVGISGATDKYMEAFDVFQAVGDTTFSVAQNFAIENWGSGTTVSATLRSTGGNLNASTAGDVEFYYLVETVKS